MELRVGSDVAIAKYAFRNESGWAFTHHGSPLLTMTPHAHNNTISTAKGVTLSPSKGDAGKGLDALWFDPAHHDSSRT